jgi:hypothetical protein
MFIYQGKQGLHDFASVNYTFNNQDISFQLKLRDRLHQLLLYSLLTDHYSSTSVVKNSVIGSDLSLFQFSALM